MKRHLFFLFTILISLQVLALKPQVYFNYSTFHLPKQNPYVEIYLSVIGNSVKYKSTQKGYSKAELEITMLFKQAEKIVDFKKYILNSPETLDSIKNKPNFIDQQRFSLPNGNYLFDLQIVDLNNVKDTLFYNDSIQLNYTDNEVQISDICFIESYTPTIKPNILSKSGYDLVPYISNFYPQSVSKLIFYVEIYNTLQVLGVDEKFLASYFIESAETGVKLSNFNSFSRKNSADVVVLFSEMPIDKLPTGNYSLAIEIKSKTNVILAEKRIYFQRVNASAELNLNDLATINIENTFANLIPQDSIDEYIRCLRPILSRADQVFAENQLKGGELKLKQQFFYNFWNTKSPAAPELAWLQYKEEVYKVQKAYSTKIKKGYETDRGRIYLKYGPPNAISQRYNEPNAYPYEIWHYHKIGNFTNRRFVFYNPDLVTNDFQLLHSDMFGEIQNPRWQVELNKRNTVVYDLYDEKAGKNQYGSEADDLYTMPR
ncbi:MAG: GWxTD domain-containing protein [Bacteroidia bacterium]